MRQATPLLEAALGQLGGLLRAGVGTRMVWLEARDGVVRLDVERIGADVHAFGRLVRAAPLMSAAQAIEALSRARALYAGDLLDGPGARAYAWVTTPAEDGVLSLREAYREQYLRATLRLARLLARDGQPAEAIPLFQALLEVEPLLEDVVRELYACHAALGDRAALLDQERQLRSALRQAQAGYAGAYAGPEDDGPEPEPATAALFSHLLEDLDLRAAQPA